MMPIYYKPNVTLKIFLGDWVEERERNGTFVTYYHKNRGCQSYLWYQQQYKWYGSNRLLTSALHLKLDANLLNNILKPALYCCQHINSKY